jgi:hypothetical protein
MTEDELERERLMREMLQRDTERYDRELAAQRAASGPPSPLVGAAVEVVEAVAFGGVVAAVLFGLSR